MKALRRTRTKICGITSPADGEAIARLGADAIGLVFYARSPRAVEAEQAAAIIAALPPFVTSVGLFVDAEPAFVHSVLDRVPLDLLQFHGDESPPYCAAFGRPYLKALRMRPDMDVRAEAERFGDAVGLLLDAYQPGTPGGTGHAFDWQRIPSDLSLPVVLAGGLGPENIQRAVEEVRPFAVDVSSGVEASKGVKDLARVAAFMQGVERADANR